MKLFENTGINKYAIKMIKEKQPFYGPIYTLNPVELETLKVYIKTHPKTGFIRLSKSFVSTPIFFDKKLDDNLCLYEDYWSFNNLMIKNWYPQSLIREFLDQLG